MTTQERAKTWVRKNDAEEQLVLLGQEIYPSIEDAYDDSFFVNVEDLKRIKFIQTIIEDYEELIEQDDFDPQLN